jgi:hypothetical protein
MEIRGLFDPSKNIYRTIEKVINYGAAQEERLESEISEYIVTDRIDDQTEVLLRKMQAAMEAGGENEVGVWVSGFYAVSTAPARARSPSIWAWPSTTRSSSRANPSASISRTG